MLFFNVLPLGDPMFFDGEWDPFPEDLYAMHAEGRFVPGLQVVIRTGEILGDMISSTSNVVSPRFLDALRSCSASGYATRPVPLVKDGASIAEFALLHVFGRGGQFDDVRSNADRDAKGTLHGHSAVYMDESQWDGSDVFFIPGLGVCLFVSERVATALEKGKLLNVEITANTQMVYGTRVDYRALERGEGTGR
jgi:hypothetical protein